MARQDERKDYANRHGNGQTWRRTCRSPLINLYSPERPPIQSPRRTASSRYFKLDSSTSFCRSTMDEGALAASSRIRNMSASPARRLNMSKKLFPNIFNDAMASCFRSGGWRSTIYHTMKSVDTGFRQMEIGVCMVYRTCSLRMTSLLTERTSFSKSWGTKGVNMMCRDGAQKLSLA